MAGDEMVNGMSNGKKMGADGAGEVANGGAQSAAKASRDVVDLGKTTGQSTGSADADLPIKVHLVNAKEMAEILKVPLSAIYEHTRKKTIPHVRFGKYCRFDPVEILAHFKCAAAGKQQNSLNKPKTVG